MYFLCLLQNTPALHHRGVNVACTKTCRKSGRHEWRALASFSSSPRRSLLMSLITLTFKQQLECSLTFCSLLVAAIARSLLRRRSSVIHSTCIPGRHHMTRQVFGLDVPYHFFEYLLSPSCPGNEPARIRN